MHKRPLRRESGAESVTYGEAYAWTFFGDWPSRELEQEFWARPDIPPELRKPPEGPDPRPILSPDAAVREECEEGFRVHKAAAVRDFERTRERWLGEVAS